jgi:hypothetical protein
VSLNTNTVEITAHKTPTESTGLFMRKGIINVIKQYVITAAAAMSMA